MHRTRAIGQDMTTGSVPKKLISFAVPFMLANALQMLFGIVNMIVVGQHAGPGGLSAVAIGNQLMMIFMSLAMGFSMGGQIYIAQLVGARDRGKINNVIGTLFTLVIIIALLMSVLVVSTARPLLILMNTPPEAMYGAVQFLSVNGFGLIFLFGYNMISAVMRGLGDAKRPFIFIAIASVLNVILVNIFVGLMQMGPMGAAMSMVISQALSFVIAIIYLYIKREAFGFDFKPKSFIIDKEIAKMLCRLGIPISIQNMAVMFSMAVVSRFINAFGVAASAAYGAGQSIGQFPNVLMMGLNFANSAMVGQNMGAGKRERAQRSVHITVLFGVTTFAIFSLIVGFFPHQMFNLFTTDPDVHELVPMIVMTMFISFPGHALMPGFLSFINGIGNTRLTMIFGIFDGVVLRIGLSFFFGIVLDMGLLGFFLGFYLAVYGMVIPCMVYYFSGVWKKRKMLVEVPAEQAGSE